MRTLVATLVALSLLSTASLAQAPVCDLDTATLASVLYTGGFVMTEQYPSTWESNGDIFARTKIFVSDFDAIGVFINEKTQVRILAFFKNDCLVASVREDYTGV